MSWRERKPREASGKLDLLVAEQAQVGQHELGPVLAQVAEEDQAQAVAQGFHAWIANTVSDAAGIPAREGARLACLFAQRFQLLVLARGLQRRFQGEGFGDLGLDQQLEQLVDVEHRVGTIQPVGSSSWARRPGSRSPDSSSCWRGTGSLAHDHAHEQGLRGAGQAGEGLR
jgi:hypothetical protein